MKMTKNIIKGLVTSIIGIITMIVTIFLVFTGSMSFVWEGIAGLCLGTILLLAPDTIIKKIGDVISAVGMNKSGAASVNDEQVIDNKQDKIDNPDKQ